MDERLTVEIDHLKIQVSKMEDKLDTLINNHMHDIDIRMTRLETTVAFGHKLMVGLCGLPAVIASVLSVVNLVKG